ARARLLRRGAAPRVPRGDFADVDQFQAPAVGARPGAPGRGQGRDDGPGQPRPRRRPRLLARPADQGSRHARGAPRSRSAGMNRRSVLAGLVLAYLAARPGVAAAQSGAARPMPEWAYSTEGFERLVHRIDGIETVTYAIGDGEPLVYFHGGGTFHGFEWVRPLADRFRVYCPYHPNFGESGDAPFDQMADYVQHYEMLFPALGLDTFHLAGASMGGHMAARYAAANPGDIDKLVLNAPAGLISTNAQMPDFGQIAPADLPKMFVTDPEWIEPFWPAEPSPEWQALRDR